MNKSIIKNAGFLYTLLYTVATILNSIIYLTQGSRNDPNGNWHEIDSAIIVFIGILAFELFHNLKAIPSWLRFIAAYIPSQLLTFGYVWLAGFRGEELAASAYRDMLTNEHLRQNYYKGNEGNAMNELIACCGLNCEKCDARIATINNDNVLREKTAQRWSEMNHATITPEMINCMGCRENGVKTPFCDSLCEIRKCALKKGFGTCGECPDLESCETIGAVHANSPDALNNLKSKKHLGK